MSCGKKTAKVLMLFGNAIFMLAGLGLTALGGYIRYASKDYDSILGKDGLGTPANLLISVGVFAFFVSLLGCCGAIKESKCFLILFIIFVVLILLLEIGCVAVAFYFKNEAEKYITDSIISAVQKTYGQSGQDAVTNAVNDIQERLKCCGAGSYKDWYTSKWSLQQAANNTVPTSCIDDNGTNSTRTAGFSYTLYTKSCIQAMKDWASSNLLLVGGIGSGVLVIEILGIFFATVLMKRTDPVGTV